ncbi:hypothetical protein Y032_0164g3567 [Ancylostoma ceylanicum]|uniref:Uncharacterized protein n=1 Tax=Ancylostoma ceylanicum TaxID=53326 RepID=A0A016SXQ7_9BILA|nr:hypothetical protein Y032_0164g3567 [Ancylostoma ceylanicum]
MGPLGKQCSNKRGAEQKVTTVPQLHKLIPMEEWCSNFIDIDGMDVPIDNHEDVDMCSVPYWFHKCGIAYRAEEGKIFRGCLRGLTVLLALSLATVREKEITSDFSQ